ncbi:MAG: aspartate kinase [Mucilaginibacter polytrichastri]|nr:aspartate kinase [Mucilaginibacter polytrichastri]
MKIFKFGGASIKDAASILNILPILKNEARNPLVIVVSAMGKTTNALEKVVFAHFAGDNAQAHALLDEVKAYHAEVMHALFPDPKTPVYDHVANTFVEAEWVLEEDPHEDEGFTYDQIVSVGEILSTYIVTAVLQQNGLPAVWLDARSCIQTDNTYREARVDMERSGELIRRHVKIQGEKGFVVTQGFIGGTSENFTTTLGREGSDYTAALFGAALSAESVTIWKDVPGVLTADPKLFPTAKKYDELSYADAIEMTYYGATVIHPKTIKPLQNAGIPLLVKPFNAIGEPGTRISETQAQATEPAIIIKQNQLLLSIATKDLSFISEDHLSGIFAQCSATLVRINMMQMSALSFSVCVDDQPEKIKKLLALLTQEFSVRYNTGLQLITMRHFHSAMLSELVAGKEILLEQLSRHTAQVVVREKTGA